MASLKVVELHSVYSPQEILEEAQERIEKRFLSGLYFPMLRVLKAPRALLNSPASDLEALDFALQRGTVTFNRGVFSGRYNASIARAMRAIGARFEKGCYRIHFDELSKDIRRSVDLSDRSFKDVLRRLDQEMAGRVKAQEKIQTSFTDLFDRAIFQANKSFDENVAGISLKIKPSKTEDQRITERWQENMDLSIKGWEEEEISKLRAKVKETYFSGDRYGTLVGLIQESHDQSERKARFLARQETNLLVSNYVQAQYQENGFPEYRWKCVRGSESHPVRYYHSLLDGTIQRWDSPPVVDKYGNRKHPGQDYNCRCKPNPIVRV